MGASDLSSPPSLWERSVIIVGLTRRSSPLTFNPAAVPGTFCSSTSAFGWEAGRDAVEFALPAFGWGFAMFDGTDIPAFGWGIWEVVIGKEVPAFGWGTTCSKPLSMKTLSEGLSAELALILSAMSKMALSFRPNV